MKTFYKFTFFMTLLIIGVVSTNAQILDVYVGGTKADQAALWKNEVAELYDGYEINSIMKVNDDFYMAGLNRESVPVVWKNDEILFTLSEFSFIGRSVSSMAIHGEDVYVTTIDLTESGLVGRLWINGVPSEDYADASELYTVCFDGDDLYVVGGTREMAVLWKNGEPFYTYDSDVTALFVDVKIVDGDIYYVGGDFGANGKYAAIKNYEDVEANQENDRELSFNIWKNGDVIYTLGNQVYGAKLEVYDGMVYASGQAPHGSAFKAIVWINGEANIVTDVWSGAQGICVHNGDVYVTGFMGDYPELDAFIWKNGELTTLASPGYDMGYCILVLGGNDGVEEINDMYNIYPNPANNYISIEGIEFDEAILYNSLGQIVISTNNNKIDLSSLESGLYLLKLDDNITRKIVIKH